jgi:elongation factor G
MVARAVRWIRPRESARGEPLLQAVVRADAGLSLDVDPWTGALLLAGADESHLRLAREKLLRLEGEIELQLPPVGYVESPVRPVRNVEGLHRKLDADGLVEEFGRCELALDPIGPDEVARFVDLVGASEDDLPVRFRPAIDDGARAALRHGPSAGYPVLGVELQLTGGDYDMLQSTEEHFRFAGQRAARAALERAGTRLLEPWWEIVVDTPQACLGDVISDLSAHRGRILGMEVEGSRTWLSAACPYRELRTFGTRLQGLSGGRASYRGHHTHHEPVPAPLVAEVVETSPFRAQASGDGPRSAGRPEPTATLIGAPREVHR